MENITQLFYNIVPGTLFILSFYFAFNGNLDLKNISTSAVFLAVILSVFIGFLAQACTKIIRKNCGINKRIYCIVKSKNKNAFEFAKNELNGKTNQLINIDENLDENEQILFLAHNYLDGRYPSNIASNYFMPRLAFWANTFVLSTFQFLVILFINLCQYNIDGNQLLVFMVNLFIIPISGYMAYKNLEIAYDCIIKTFATVRKLK